MDDLPVGADPDDTVSAKLREAIDSCLSADYLPGQPPPVPASFKIDSPRDAVKDAFQLVGGVPRLASWADKNFDRFVMGPLAKIITAQPGASKDEPIHVRLSFDLGNRFGRIIEGETIAEAAPQVPESATVGTGAAVVVSLPVRAGKLETAASVQVPGSTPADAAMPKKKKKKARA